MRRRDFLTSAAAAAVVATWPRFISRAFADKACTTPGASPALAALATAWKQAQRAGKPLLVLVIPDDDGEKWARGHAWGELLNHGSAEQIAPFALVEVACAGMADLRLLLPSAGAGSPWAVLVDTDRVPAHLERLDVVLPPLPGGFLGDDDGEGKEDPVDVVIGRRQELLARMLRGAIVPNEQVIALRAALARKRLAAADRARLETFLTRDTWIPSELADRGAALLFEAIAARQLNAGRATSLLRDAMQARLIAEPPAGAHWATSQGCGTDVEETRAEREEREAEERAGRLSGVYVSVGCGMGHIPEKSVRFLYFFAVEHPGTQL